MAKINKPRQTTIAQKIRKPDVQTDLRIRFSFAYFAETEKFSLPDSRKTDYLRKLFEQLRNLSQWKISEFRNKGKGIRAHCIKWKDTTEPNGFAHLNNEQLKEAEPWQFQLSSNEYGRIHGFLIDNVFYVVWADPEHKLYS